MVERIYHVGLTVSDLDRSIAFYRDILGLEFQGEIFMAGEETDRLFRMKDTKARVAYLNGSKAIVISHIKSAHPIEMWRSNKLGIKEKVSRGKFPRLTFFVPCTVRPAP